MQDLAVTVLSCFEVDVLKAIWKGCKFYDEQYEKMFSVEISFQSLLKEEYTVGVISKRYGFQTFKFEEFCFLFDRKYMFTPVVSESYRRTYWSDAFTARKAIREAGKSEMGEFVLWMVERNLTGGEENTDVVYRALAYDIRLAKRYAELSVPRSRLYELLYIISFYTTKMQQYADEGVCIDGYALASSDLISLLEKQIHQNFYIACARKGNLEMYANPDLVPEHVRQYVAFRVPTRREILVSIRIGYADGCCCSKKKYIEFFQLTPEEIGRVFG